MITTTNTNADHTASTAGADAGRPTPAGARRRRPSSPVGPHPRARQAARARSVGNDPPITSTAVGSPADGLSGATTHAASRSDRTLRSPLIPRRSERLLAAEAVALACLVGVDTPMPWPTVRAAVALTAVAAGIAWRRRSGRWTGGIIRLVVGLSGLIAGAGIGIHHAATQPMSVRTVAGMVTLAGGVLLTSLAAIDLVRVTRGWRKLLALPVGIGVLILVVVPVTMAVFVTNAPPYDAISATPADYGLAYEDVAITTSDDVRLTGYYVPSANGASVIVLGGLSGFSEQEIGYAELLARHGYGALLLNVRGQGDSEGDSVLWGWWGEVDVAAGIEYLADRPDVDEWRIGAIGMSVGGEQAISAAGVDHRLRAVVSEGATARGARDEGDPAEGAGGLLVRHVDWLSRAAAGLMTSADHPTPLRESIAAFHDQRALIIAAGTRPTEIAAARRSRTLRRPPSRCGSPPTLPTPPPTAPIPTSGNAVSSSFSTAASDVIVVSPDRNPPQNGSWRARLGRASAGPRDGERSA